MLPIVIDPSDFINQSSMTEGEVKNFTGMLLDRLALKFQEEWMDIIKENLHSTRQEYERGMFLDRPDDNTIVFGVTARKSKLAVDLELGKDAFDEKPGFAASSKKTMKKGGNGWYLTIPFRYATPGSVGESSAFASIMPQEVLNLAKNQTKPIELNQLSPALQQKGIRQTLQIKDKTIPAYQHKAAKYEGLIRVVDERENRGQYVTFRRVSDKSDANAFYHPGFKPYNLLGKALEKTDVSTVVRVCKIDFMNNR